MNAYIETWKKTVDVIITAYKVFFEKMNGKYETESEDLRQLASKQIKLLDDSRPNKEKCLYEQSNKEQKEFIDYLEKVIVYGNIEGEEKCQF